MTNSTGFRKIAGIENVMHSLYVFEQGEASVAGYKKSGVHSYLPSTVFNKASLRSLALKGYLIVFRDNEDLYHASFVKLTKQGKLYCFREFVR